MNTKPVAPASSTIALIVGIGANSLEIPLRVMPDVASAHTLLSGLGLKPDGDDTYGFDESKGFPEDDDAQKVLFEALFAKGRYYNGCGGCYSLEIREVEMNQPLVRWNLD